MHESALDAPGKAINISQCLFCHLLTEILSHVFTVEFAHHMDLKVLTWAVSLLAPFYQTLWLLELLGFWLFVIFRLAVWRVQGRQVPWAVGRLEGQRVGGLAQFGKWAVWRVGM